MDFSRLTTGCTFKYITWTADFIRVDDAISISPNQARASALTLPYKLRGIDIPADIQAEADALLKTSFKLTPTLTKLHKYIHVTSSGEEIDWAPSIVDIQDPGYVLLSGNLAEVSTEDELEALAREASDTVLTPSSTISSSNQQTAT